MLSCTVNICHVGKSLQDNSSQWISFNTFLWLVWIMNWWCLKMNWKWWSGIIYCQFCKICSQLRIAQAFRWGELTNKVASKVTAYFWLPFNMMGEKLLLQYNHGGFLVCLVCQEICAKCCHDNFVIISYIMWNYKLALKFCAKIKAWVTCHPWMLNN